MKAALVGCGKIADAHVAALRRLDHLVRLEAVVDTEPLMAEQLARRARKVRAYTSVAAMLERERPDVVHVTAPPAVHLEVGSMSLRAGCHLYVEKPLATRLSDGLRLLEEAALARRKVVTGLTYHFDPALEALRRTVAAGRIGEVVHADCVYGYDLGGDYGAAVLARTGHWVRTLRGGLLGNTLDHMLDAVAEWLPPGRPEIHVLAPRPETELEGVGPTEVRILLERRGVSASALFSCRSRPPLHRLTLFGTRDTVTADLRDRSQTFEARATLPSSLGRALAPFVRGAALAGDGAENLAAFARGRFGFFEGMVSLMQRFYESVAHGTEPPIPHDRLVWMAEVGDRIVTALEARRSDGGAA